MTRLLPAAQSLALSRLPAATRWWTDTAQWPRLRRKEEGGFRALVLGDPHGHWRLGGALLAGYFEAVGSWPDAIFALGDLSYYPDATKLDKASRRHGAKDPEQLTGFDRLLNGKDLHLKPWLKGAPPIDCIGGNHEGHQEMAVVMKQRGDQISIGTGGHVRLLRSGVVHDYTSGDGVSVRVGALWGVAAGDGRLAAPMLGKHIQTAEVERLRRSGWDVLLSHDGPRATGMAHREGPEGAGSLDISSLVAPWRDRIHLHGHYHHREGRVSGISHQLGILRAEVPTSVAVLQGHPGAWELVPWAADQEWRSAAIRRVLQLPPSAIAADAVKNEDPANE